MITYTHVCPFTLWTFALISSPRVLVPFREHYRYGLEVHWLMRGETIPAPGQIPRERQVSAAKSGGISPDPMATPSKLPHLRDAEGLRTRSDRFGGSVDGEALRAFLGISVIPSVSATLDRRDR